MCAMNHVRVMTLLPYLLVLALLWYVTPNLPRPIESAADGSYWNLNDFGL